MSETLKYLGNILSAAPAAGAGLVIPDPKTGIPLTGAGSQLYGFADLITRSATGLAADLYNHPPGEQFPSSGSKVTDLGNTFSRIYNSGVGLPGAHAVEEAGARTRERAHELLPPQEATTSAERVGQAGVEGLVSMGLPIPGISKLPTVAREAAALLAPGTMAGKAGGVMMGLGGATGVAGGVGSEMDRAAADPLASLSLADAPIEAPSAPLTPDASAAPASDPLAQLTLADAPTDYGSEMDKIVHKPEDTGMTWGRLFSYGAMAAGVVVGHKVLNAAMADRVATAREARYNGQQTLLDADAAGRANGTIGAGTPMPDLATPPRGASAILPDAVAKASLRLRTKFVDKNAGLEAASDYYAPNVDIAEALRAQYGTKMNDGSVLSRIRDFAKTGHDDVSGVSMSPITDHFERVSTWDQSTKQLYLDARNAANELDNRAIRVRDYNSTAGADESRVNFRSMDDAALKKQVADGFANPDVAYELHTMQVHYNRMTEIMSKSGLVDAGQAAKFMQDHPNYMPSYDTSGTINNPLQARDYTSMSGHDAATTPVWELDAQHFQSVLRQRDQNVAVSKFVEQALAAQAADPKMVKMFTPRTDVSGVEVAGKSRPIGYRLNGQQRYVDVASSELRSLLDPPITAQSALIRAASGISALSRSGTTQALAAIGGAPFSALNALRTNARVMIAAKPEMYTGQLDAALSKVTGDRLRLPGGLDPTAYLNPFIGTARNAYGGLQDARVSFLRGPDTGPGGWARKLLRDAYGQQGYEAMVQRAEIAAETSTRGMMSRLGALDSAGMSARDIETSRLADKTQGASIAGNLVPELFLDQGMLGQGRAKVVRLNNMFKEVLSWVGESAQTQHFALNRNNPNLARQFGADADTVLTYNTRQSAGDVGQRGSSEAFRNYAAISKYSNVAVQDWANMLDAFARAPFRTSLNMMTTMGLPALASVYTAMLHGPDAINYLFNELTDDQRGSKVPFFIPGVAPEAAATIPYSQNERWVIAPMLQLFADAFNLQAHGTGDSTYEWAKAGLEDLFSKHITESTANSAERGLAAGTEIIAPDVVQVGMAAATGKRLKLDPVDLLAGGDKPLQQRLTAPVGSSIANVPNVQNDNDANAGAITHKMFWDVASALFGAVASGIHQDAMMATQNYKANHDPVEAAVTAAQSYGQRLSATMPFANGTLWQVPAKMALGTPLSDSVHQAVEKYRPLLTAMSDIRNEGMTRHGGMELPATPGSQPKVPTDPLMQDLYLTASKLGKQLISGNNAPMKEVQDYDKLIRLLPSSGKSPAQIREENNQLVRQRAVALQRAAEYINDGNLMLSQIVGKSVDIRNIDFHKGPEQFTRREH